MTITDGDAVTIEYVGRLTDGTVFDTSDEALAREAGIAEENPEREFEPLTIQIGDDKVIAGLQDALLGMAEGETELVQIPPERAYGEYREDRVGEYDREAFEEMLGGREATEGVEVETEEGLPGEVVDVGPETVTVDFNHELAGETLSFEIEIVDVE
jgi:FKBP-type peptidyl-prolyl cis-trans isomerase 2